MGSREQMQSGLKLLAQGLWKKQSSGTPDSYDKGNKSFANMAVSVASDPIDPHHS